jgi:radical SAM superfamily enzyme YgiQ (UPF0313 family)
MRERVVLVNANRIRPPIAPIALDYLGSALEDAGLAVEVVDLAWQPDAGSLLAPALGERPLVVGLTWRNLDDSSAASRASFVEEQCETVAAIRAGTDAPIVLGGAGVSIAPQAALCATGADYAVRGEGEAALPLLAAACRREASPLALERVPGLIWRDGGGMRENVGPPLDLGRAATPRRTFVDNARYLREGAQVGFETSRGCPAACAYCADPIAKGRALRRRAPPSVASELEALLAAGVDVFHTCDSEYNADPGHAVAVAQAITDRGLGERIRWYAYCMPWGFGHDQARAMRKAGCAGINFGVDHTQDGMLAKLGRVHRLADVERARRACREAGIAVMLDLLFGAPGESRASMRECLGAMRALDAEAVGVALGVRLYRGTPFGDRLARGGELLEPAFFVEPGLGDDVFAWLTSELDGDPRFFFLGAAGEQEGVASYNYNAHAALEQAIAAGARGAYWDILRRMHA